MKPIIRHIKAFPRRKRADGCFVALSGDKSKPVRTMCGRLAKYYTEMDLFARCRTCKRAYKALCRPIKCLDCNRHGMSPDCPGGPRCREHYLVWYDKHKAERDYV